MATGKKSPPSQVILWSQGRTACHLLERMLSKQPNTKYLWHPYVSARFAAAPLFTEAASTGTIRQENRSDYLKAIDQGTAAWTEALEQAKAEGHALFVHEHPQFAISLDTAVSFVASEWNQPMPSPPENFTLIPDSITLHPGTVPILTFRHPAYLMPAAFRALRDAEGNPDDFNVTVVSTLRWQRTMYAWYVAHGFTPIVVEADDYMSSPEFVKKLCVEAGMDPEAAIFKWERVPEEDRAALPPPALVLLKTLFDSEGLRPELAKKGNVDVEAEEKKWEQEYGDKTTTLLKKLVNASMADYEFLEAKKLRL